MNPIATFWNWKPPKGGWIPYVVLIAAIVVIVAINVISR